MQSGNVSDTFSTLASQLVTEEEHMIIIIHLVVPQIIYPTRIYRRMDNLGKHSCNKTVINITTTRCLSHRIVT